MKIMKWFQERKQRIKKDAYDSGFNYAIGAIIRGERTPIYFDSILWRKEWSNFDHGIDTAVDKAIELGIVKDDRI